MSHVNARQQFSVIAILLMALSQLLCGSHDAKMVGK
jgi:hypothetical protein